MRIFSFLAIVLLSSCGAKQAGNANVEQGKVAVPASISKDIEFLKRSANVEADGVSSIQINEANAKQLDGAERAALGYVVTFIGSDCDWADGQAENLDCMATKALGLGYQCSEEHLGFLRKWFAGDAKALETLANCVAVPYTATVQTSFDEIKLWRKDGDIRVTYRASFVNLREEEYKEWESVVYFEAKGEQIRWVKEERKDLPAKQD